MEGDKPEKLAPDKMHCACCGATHDLVYSPGRQLLCLADYLIVCGVIDKPAIVQAAKEEQRHGLA